MVSLLKHYLLFLCSLTKSNLSSRLYKFTMSGFHAFDSTPQSPICRSHFAILQFPARRSDLRISEQSSSCSDIFQFARLNVSIFLHIFITPSLQLRASSFTVFILFTCFRKLKIAGLYFLNCNHTVSRFLIQVQNSTMFNLSIVLYCLIMSYLSVCL